MVSFNDTIRLSIEVAEDKAKAGLKSLKTEIADAEGGWNKFKAAGSGAFDIIKDNATVFALSAGTAIGAFVVKAVGDYNKLALGAGDLADKTGLAVGQASRFQEVLHDLGLPVTALETAMGRMNKAVENTPAKFAALGIEIAHTKDGAYDAQGTFLNVIDALHKMPNASAEAAAGTAIFGRGWQSLSLLVSEGAGQVRDQLASVEKQKIVNPAQVAQAREFKATMADLHDRAEDLTLTLGKALAPAFAEVAADAAGAIGPLTSVIAKILEINHVSAPPTDKPLGWLDIPEHVIKKPLDLKGNWDLFARSFNESLGGGAANVKASLDPALLNEWAASTDEAVRGNEGFGASFADWAAKVGGAAQGITIAEAALSHWADKAAAGKGVTEGFTKSQKDLADMLKGVTDALNAESGAAQSAADDQIAAQDAFGKFGKSLADEELAAKAATDATHKHGAASQEATDATQKLTDAQNNTRDSAIDLARKNVQLASDQAAAGGAALTASQKLDIQNDSLLKTASAAKGPARDGILTYIATLNGIPPEKLTDIIAAIDRGDLATAESLLNSASRTRQADVVAEATNVATTENALNNLARDRSARVVVSTVNVPGQANAPAHYARGGTVGAGGGIAGEDYLPEILNDRTLITSPTYVPPGTRVTGEAETARRLAAGNTYNITIQASSDRPGDIAEAMSRWAWQMGASPSTRVA